MTKLYVAYGSNLNKRQMRQRCPTARSLGKFILKKAKLVFRGVADLEFDPKSEAPCGLWLVNRDDERSLDHYEGIRLGKYFKTEEIEIEYAGRKRKTLLYLMNDTGVYPPSQAYANKIRRGYRDFGIDERYLDEAIARAFSEKAPSNESIARRLRQRATRSQRDLVQKPVGFRKPRGESVCPA